MQNIYPMLTSTISDDGKTTVPAGVRKALKAPPGTLLEWVVNGSTAKVLRAAKPSPRKRRRLDYEAILKELQASPTVSSGLLKIRRSKPE